MIQRELRLVGIALLFSLPCTAARGGPINFDNNNITLTKPTVYYGDGTEAKFTSNNPQLKKLADGLSVVDFSWTATISSLPQGSKSGLVYIEWSTARIGVLGQNQDIVLTTSGNTDVSASNGDVFFSIRGSLDSGSANGPNGSVLYSTSFEGPVKNKAIKWADESNTWTGVKAGNRTLTLKPDIRWSGVVVGDTLTVSSEYTLLAVPEPSGLVLASIALAGAVLFRMSPAGRGWQRKGARRV